MNRLPGDINDMFLDAEFHRLLSVGVSPRVLPRMRPVMEFINGQLTRTIQKFNKYSGYQHTGFRLLCNTLTLGMSDDLAACTTDVERLYSVLNLQRIYFTRMFDSSSGNSHVHQKYFIGNSGCKEYIFSVVPRDQRKSYPLDKGVNEWKKYRAFRLIDHDSADQTLNIQTGYLMFGRNPPHFAIYTLDPVAAVLQYNALKDTVSLEQYVHEYLILPAIALDNQRLWMMGIYSEWFYSRSRSYTDIPMLTTNYSHIPVNLDKALGDVGSVIDSARSGNVSVQRLLSSLPIPYNTTISQYATVLYNRSSVDDVSEYDWGTFMIYRRMLDVAARVLQCTINNRESQVDVARLKRAVELMINARIYSSIGDVYTKHFVRQSVETLHMQVMNMYSSIRSA